MKTTASIIDFPKSGLDLNVWGVDLKLLPEHKTQILNKLNNYFRTFNFLHSTEWIQKIKIIGSLCSWQWRNDSDIDVHIEVDVEKFNKAEFDGKISTEYAEKILDEVGRTYLNKSFSEKLGYTLHDMEFFFELYHDDKLTEGQSVVEYDGVYNLETDQWEKDPREVTSVFNPEEIFSEVIASARKLAEKFDIQLGVIKRDVIDVEYINEALSTFNDKRTIDVYKKEIDNKINEIETEIKEYLKMSKKVTDERKKAKSQYDDSNLVMKFLAKYAYLYIARQLDKFMENTPKITERSIFQLLKILEDVK